MAPKVGREFTLMMAGAVILAGVQTKSVEHTAEAVDITSDDDDGWQTFLPVPGKRAVNISFNGVTKSADLRSVVMSGTNCMLSDVTITYADGGTLIGDFFLSGLTYDGDHADAVKMSGTLSSSGPVVAGV